MPHDAANQPRPALGRRPWLALERRARSLRRFFLAIVGGTVPGRSGQDPTRVVMATTGTWASGPLVVASTSLQRWRGKAMAGDHAVLFTGARARRRRGLAAVRVIGVGDGGTVIGVGVLGRRSVRLAGARWLIEQSMERPVPTLGTQLAWRTASAADGEPGS